MRKMIIIIVLLLLIGLAYFFYRMDKKFIKEEKYWKPIYSDKTTIWQIPLYFTLVFIMIFIVALFS